MNAAEKQLRRLIALDAAMSSPVGCHRETFAAEHGIDGRTVQRLIDAIKAVGMDVQSHRIDSPSGWWYVYRYESSRQRMFSPAAIELANASRETKR